MSRLSQKAGIGVLGLTGTTTACWHIACALNQTTDDPRQHMPACCHPVLAAIANLCIQQPWPQQVHLTLQAVTLESLYALAPSNSPALIMGMLTPPDLRPSRSPDTAHAHVAAFQHTIIHDVSHAAAALRTSACCLLLAASAVALLLLPPSQPPTLMPQPSSCRQYCYAQPAAHPPYCLMPRPSSCCHYCPTQAHTTPSFTQRCSIMQQLASSPAPPPTHPGRPWVARCLPACWCCQ